MLFLYLKGTDKTFQRADLGEYGVTFKVVPMYTEKDGNYIGCWKLEGHKGWPIIAQPIVPNMTYFTVRHFNTNIKKNAIPVIQHSILS